MLDEFCYGKNISHLNGFMFTICLVYIINIYPLCLSLQTNVLTMLPKQLYYTMLFLPFPAM